MSRDARVSAPAAAVSASSPPTSGVHAMADWNAFVGDVAKARERLGFLPHEECFYRGVGDDSWELEPTLFYRAAASFGRPRDDDDAEKRAFRTKVHKLEYDLFYEFEMRVRGLGGARTADSWETLFMMRHHGVPCRLIDWTETLGVAVHFALAAARATDAPGVWVLNPYRLNERRGVRDLYAPDRLTDANGTRMHYDAIITSDEIKFGFNTPLALYPQHSNARLRAQGGYFTLHGDDPRPLEKSASDCVSFVALPDAARASAEAFLQQSGINEFTLFPDPDGLARFLNRKYGLGG
jgi:hypothetical protein